MKHIKYINILLAFLFVTLISCEKKYLEDDRVTFFADIVIAGDPVVMIATGETYVDAGATATENGVEIEMITKSTVDMSTPGTYYVDYSAVNSDGFSKTASRQVLVYDADLNTTNLSGTYSANVVRNGSESYAGNSVILSPTGIDGVYYISDWIAGFYDIGRDYGASYRFTGILQINASNEVIEINMANAWDDPFDDVSGTYDPGTGVINYTANWIGTYAFVVDMAK